MSTTTTFEVKAVGGSGGKERRRDEFQQLVRVLSDALGPTSGLTSDDVDVDLLRHHMQRYVSRETEWSKYCFADEKRGYTRNLVDEGNGKSNLLVLVWTPGRGSPIHDHGNAHCLMKILKGELTETRYAFPSSDKVQPMQVISERTYRENTVAYMTDELGVHRITNPGNSLAVSLHLYSPPNVARSGCHVFNPESGTKMHIQSCGYFSAYGRRLSS